MFHVALDLLRVSCASHNAAGGTNYIRPPATTCSAFLPHACTWKGDFPTPEVLLGGVANLKVVVLLYDAVLVLICNALNDTLSRYVWGRVP